MATKIIVKSLDGTKEETYKATSIQPCKNLNGFPMYTVILDTGKHFPICSKRLINDGGLLDE